MSSDEVDPPVLSLPALVEALEIGTQPPSQEELIPDKQLHVHHEEVVETLESTSLTVVLDAEVENIMDLHPSVVILADDVVAVENQYSEASNNLMAILDDITTEGNFQNSSIHEEDPSPSPEEETEQDLVPLPASFPADETEQAFEQVLVLEQDLDSEPAIVQEDEAEPVSDHEDPLAPSPLLLDMGFGRVQAAYEQWLRNMSHTVS